jgi:hypothetical protein
MITLDNIKQLLREGNNPIVKQRVFGSNRINYYSLHFSIDIQLSNGTVITIPKGFKWDLASVPKILQWLLSPDVDSEIAYLIHDYLYRYKLLSREDADLEMYIWAIATNGTSKLSARNIDNWLRYVAVRLFGLSSYKK